jgi:hypothetical protein
MVIPPNPEPAEEAVLHCQVFVPNSREHLRINLEFVNLQIGKLVVRALLDTQESVQRFWRIVAS